MNGPKARPDDRRKSTGATLTKRWEYQRVYKHGRKIWNFALVLYVLERPPDDPTTAWRYGVTATKRIGKATKRNRVKRLIRESFRLSADRIRDGVDIVAVARAPLLDMKQPEVQRHLLNLLKRGRALHPASTDAVAPR